jgi:AraC-like DNA-binding protein
VTAVLFTCAGQRVDVVTAFARAGGHTIAVDANPLAPAIYHADVHAVVPRIDDPDYLTSLKELIAEHDVKLVVPLTDLDQLLLAEHRDEIDAVVLLPDPEVVRRTADKYLAHLFFEERGIPSPPSWLPEELPADLEVWLMGTPPADTSDYVRAFAPARIHFASSFSGFSFDARHLGAPLRATDPKLHEVMRKHMELVLGTLPQLQSYTERVRSLLIRELSGGNATAVHLARLMHTSLSTLGRRLEAEGTTFSAILEDLRRRLALGYLASRQLSVPEVALLTGFSQATAFHRAFRRWTGKTPLQYRRERRELGALPPEPLQTESER